MNYQGKMVLFVGPDLTVTSKREVAEEHRQAFWEERRKIAAIDVQPDRHEQLGLHRR